MKKEDFINETLSRLISMDILNPVFLANQSIYLTPRFEHYSRNRFTFKDCALFYFKLYYKPFVKKLNLKELISYPAFAANKKDLKKTIAIYFVDLIYPDNCCCCSKLIEKYEIIEFTQRVTSLQTKEGSTIIPKVAEWEELIVENAMASNRYWILLPFCNEHNLSSGYIAFEDFDKQKIMFKNRDFARAFEKLNSIKGYWRSRNYKIFNYIYFFLSIIVYFPTMFLFLKHGKNFTFISEELQALIAVFGIPIFIFILYLLIRLTVFKNLKI